MNIVILMGRLTRDPDIRQSTGAEPITVARYTLAVDRRTAKQDEQQSADFIQCVAFGKAAEFAQRYFTQGQRVLIRGRWQSGSYTNRDGQKVYTNDCIIETQEFADSKSQNATGARTDATETTTGFIPVPDALEDEGLPFD